MPSLGNIRFVGRFFDKNGSPVGDSLQITITQAVGAGVAHVLGGATHTWGLSPGQLTPSWINANLRPGVAAKETDGTLEAVSCYHMGTKVYYTANGRARTKSSRLGRGGHRVQP